MTDFSASNYRTIIGAVRFHDRVRDGVEWFPRAKVARQKGGKVRCVRGVGDIPHALGVAGSSRTVN